MLTRVASQDDVSNVVPPKSDTGASFPIPFRFQPLEKKKQLGDGETPAQKRPLRLLQGVKRKRILLETATAFLTEPASTEISPASPGSLGLRFVDGQRSAFQLGRV